MSDMERDARIKDRVEDTTKPIKWEESPKPVRHGVDSVKRRRQMAFLEAYSQCGTITQAARFAGINARTHSRWIDTDPWYAEQFDICHEQYLDVIKAEIHRRAIDGIQVPITGKLPDGGTGIIGHKTVYSDLLLMFHAKKHDPTYRDKVEVTGKDGGPIQTTSPLDELIARVDVVAKRNAGNVIDITPEPKGALKGLDSGKEKVIDQDDRLIPAEAKGTERALNPALREHGERDEGD